MKKVISIFVLALIAFSCERTTETLGPNLSDLYGSFSVLEDFEASRNTVQFSSGQAVVFTCRFNKTVDWEVHIVGQTSGAEKILSGKTNRIDENNGGLWDGSTTNLPMFKREECLAYVTVAEEGFSDTIANFITVDSVKTNEGFVVADFENGINPGWTIFAQSGANMSFKIVQSDSAGQGDHYYDMGGEVDFDFLIGLMEFPADAYGETSYPLAENPNNVYFNVLLDKPEGINNEIVLFRFNEDEDGNGIFDPATEDQYALELRGLETNWQTISVKYADLISLVNGQPATPAGNGVHEPHKLLFTEVLFLADPASGYSQTLMDYIIFTENGPLLP
jgi:hypothetical protein